MSMPAARIEELKQFVAFAKEKQTTILQYSMLDEMLVAYEQLQRDLAASQAEVERLKSELSECTSDCRRANTHLEEFYDIADDENHELFDAGMSAGSVIKAQLTKLKEQLTAAEGRVEAGHAELPCGHPAGCAGKALDGVGCGWCADLADLNTVVDHCSKVYDYMTASRISKPMTLPETVIAVHEDLRSEQDREALKEATEELEHALADEQSWAAVQTQHVNELTQEIRARQSSGPERESNGTQT